MTITDYALDILLIGLVAFQIRGLRLTRKAILLPLVLVPIVALNFVKTIPTAGNDLVLIVALTAVGATLGWLAGLCTSLFRDSSGTVVAKAGVLAAILWILGVGSRFAFQLYVTHGGLPTVARFSAAHDIKSGAAWTAAIVFMALTEVVARQATIVFRASRRFGFMAAPVAPAVSGRTMIGTSGSSF